MAKILVIEDDEHIAQLLSFMLEREGHAIEHLADGEAAHHQVLTSSPPALVLLDAMLPYRDGLSLLAAMRAQTDGWSGVPVIMLTARSLERDIVRALEAGANDYVVKPFQPQELLARVRRYVRPANT
ncbi:MAG: response regulator transcription factor [Burkholderiales bacterium]|jgi:DNA-binding response OmpR family regulator|nr:response regulator transcription factor [Burkholderiales bacterium]